MSPTLAWSTGTRGSTDWLTNWPTDCPSQSRDTNTLHIPMLSHHVTLMCVVVKSAVHSSGDNYKTKSTDDGQAKSRGDTHTMNYEAGTRETSKSPNTWASSLVSPSFHVHQFFLPATLHKPFITLFYIKHDTCTPHLDKTSERLMHTGMHSPHPLV